MVESMFMAAKYVDFDGLLLAVEDQPWMLHTQSGVVSQEIRLQQLCEEVIDRLSDTRPLQISKRVKPSYMTQILREDYCNEQELCEKLGIDQEEVMETGPFIYNVDYAYGFGMSFEHCKDEHETWRYQKGNEAFTQGVEDAKEMCELLGF